MNLTERILELLKSDTLKTREVADILGANAGNVSGTISRLVRQGLVVVVNNSRKGHWTYRAAKGANIGPTLGEQIIDLLKTDNLTAPEIDRMLDVGKASIVSSSLSTRVKMGVVKIVGSRPSETTGRMINVYGINPKYASNRRSSSITRDKEVNKELRKHFRVFRPTHDRHVLGVWM